MNLPPVPRSSITTFAMIPRAAPLAINVLDGLDADTISALMRETVAEHLNAAEQADIDDTLEAVVPALVELRDQHGQELTLYTVVNSATGPGFARLANDERLSRLNRLNCAAMARRHTVYLQRALHRLRQARSRDEGLDD